MTYVIAEPCIGQKDNSCVEVCQVDCIHPTPDEPDYASWWLARLISVGRMKRDGQPVEWAESPPVPLGPEAPKTEEKPKAKKPRKKKSA